MTRRLLRCTAITTVVIAGLTAEAGGPAPLKTFRDMGSGVSFRYPAAWTANSLNDFMRPAILNGPGRPAKATATVGVAGIPRTTLTGIVFTFAWTNATDESSCLALTLLPGFSGILGDEPRWVIVGANRFWRSHGSDARDGHSADQIVFAAFEPAKAGSKDPGRCLLFEQDMDFVARDVGDQTLNDAPHSLTIALAHKLQDIIETVKLPPDVPGASPSLPAASR